MKIPNILKRSLLFSVLTVTLALLFVLTSGTDTAYAQSGWNKKATEVYEDETVNDVPEPGCATTTNYKRVVCLSFPNQGCTEVPRYPIAPPSVVCP